MAQRLTEQVARHRGLEYRELRRRRKPAPIGDEPEKEFMARVRQLAYVCGWWPRRWKAAGWHHRDSTGTSAGWPDLALVRPPRLILAELKSQHGRLSLDQAEAIALFEQVPGIETYVWKPSDWQEIVRVLR